MVFAPGIVQAQGPQQPSQSAVLFQNVRVFDGKSGDAFRVRKRPRARQHNREHLAAAIPTDRSANTTLINGGGRTLMPGLIDMHWHTMLVRPTPAALLTGDIGHLNLMAGAEATDTLLRGFTTVRDMGGPAFGLKRAIDEGIVVGPRIYPSGAIRYVAFVQFILLQTTCYVPVHGDRRCRSPQLPAARRTSTSPGPGARW